MSFGIGPIGNTYQPLVASPRAGRPADAPVDPPVPSARFTADRVELSFGSPPPELHQEIEFAYSRALDLAAKNRELHFAKDEETDRIIVQVRDLDGNVIRTIPSADALEVMAGAELS